ncbi:MAG: urease accessory UreF family protein [Pseudomonadota bacterium]
MPEGTGAPPPEGSAEAALGPREAALLHAWLSPGYPTGAFAYSHGLEQAIAAGEIADTASLESWLTALLAHGGGRSEALLVAEAWMAPEDDRPAERARALAASAERLRETEAQGRAFAAVTAAAYTGSLGDDRALPYPVALGRAARAEGIPLAALLPLALQSFATNLVSAAVRLVPLGQTEAQRVVHALLPVIARVAAEAHMAAKGMVRAGMDPLDAHGSACFRSDIAAMQHETLETRLFRT